MLLLLLVLALPSKEGRRVLHPQEHIMHVMYEDRRAGGLGMGIDMERWPEVTCVCLMTLSFDQFQQ